MLTLEQVKQLRSLLERELKPQAAHTALDKGYFAVAKAKRQETPHFKKAIHRSSSADSADKSAIIARQAADAPLLGERLPAFKAKDELGLGHKSDWISAYALVVADRSLFERLHTILIDHGMQDATTREEYSLVALMAATHSAGRLNHSPNDEVSAHAKEWVLALLAMDAVDNKRVMRPPANDQEPRAVAAMKHLTALLCVSLKRDVTPANNFLGVFLNRQTKFQVTTTHCEVAMLADIAKGAAADMSLWATAEGAQRLDPAFDRSQPSSQVQRIALTLSSPEMISPKARADLLNQLDKMSFVWWAAGDGMGAPKGEGVEFMTWPYDSPERRGEPFLPAMSVERQRPPETPEQERRKHAEDTISECVRGVM